MVMKNLKYIFILFLFLQFSCIDDKSKFGGNEIDAITIEGIERVYRNRNRYKA